FFLMRANWLYVTRGIFTPAFFQANWTRPEQSKACGPVAPYRYGSPICFLATATALRAFIFCRAALVCFLDVAASTVFTVVSASAGADSEGPFTVSACAAGTWRPRPPAVTATVSAAPRRARRDRRGFCDEVDRIAP